jgi:hypothetical protein
MGLFRSSDDGCTAHHWGDYSLEWERASVSLTDKKAEYIDGEWIRCIELQIPEVTQCQHDGCNETTEKLQPTQVYVPLDAAVGHNASALKPIVEAMAESEHSTVEADGVVTDIVWE